MSHRPRKRFGQNFLHDPVIIYKIINAIRPKKSDALLEIGPGQGAITCPLLEAAGKLTVVELDRDLIGPLQARCSTLGELTVHSADALTFDFCAVAGQQMLRVIGNLPYNISTPLLFHLLDQHQCIQDMHFMLQKEVVERMAASPGCRPVRSPLRHAATALSGNTAVYHRVRGIQTATQGRIGLCTAGAL